MRLNLKHAILVVCLSCSCGLSAQTDTVTHSRSVADVNVEARRARVSSMPVQTIDGRQLQRQGIRSLADAVRRFNGTNVKDYGGIGGLKTVSVRSFGATHTAVSYDGVVLSNCQAGPIDVGRFNLNNVGSLSLSIGQDDALLQPARAFSSVAVLSVNSVQPTFDSNRRTQFKCILQGGSFGYFDADVNGACKLGRCTSLSGNAEMMRANGEYAFTLVNGRSTTRERRINTDVSSVQGEINLFRADSCSRLHAKAYAFYSERGLPGAVIYYNPVANERLWDKNLFLQADYRRVVSSVLSCRFQGKYNYSWNKYEDVNVKYASGRQTDLNTQNEGYMSVSALCEPLHWLAMSLAGDVACNTLSSNMANNPQPRRTTLVSAFNARCSWSMLSATATLVATHIAEKVESGAKPDDRNRLSPTFALNFRLAPNVGIRAMYKSTYRVPTFNELYYTTIGNTYLRPELADEFNVGVTYLLNINNINIEFMADAFRNYVNDKIVAVPTTYVWKMHNCGKVEVTGADVSLKAQIAVNEKISVDVNGGYSYQKAIDVTDANDVFYGDQIPYTPLHSGNWQMSVDVPWLSFGYTAIASGKRYYMKQNLPANAVPAYVEHTASLTGKFRVGGCCLALKFDAVNFTDKQYEVIRFYPMPGRSWRLSLMLSV